LLDSNEAEQWIVTEFFPEGTLERHPSRYKGRPVLALQAFRSLLETVASLHKDKIVHRDIKPANVFIGNDGRLILGDFGIAYVSDQMPRVTLTEERVGPWDYMPQWADIGERLENVEPNFDVTVTGFETAEIDLLIGELSPDGDNDPADAVVEVAAGPAVTRPGDIWRIGSHRLICGDSTRSETYQALLGEQRAQLVFTDPPYNVPIAGHVGGLGAVQHREFAMASGEMSPAEFTAFLQTVFGHLAAYSVDGSIHFQCMDWRHLQEMLAAGTAAYSDLKNLCVWAKNNGGMGSLYRSQHELVFVFKSGTAPHINNVELGKHGRYRTNVWSYAGVNSFGGDRDDLSLHPTVKPVAMVADAIRDCSHRKAIVLDAFAGSGTTLIAAEKTGRRGYGIEIDPAYCDVTIRRLHAVCGLDAVLDATGQPFAEIEALQGGSGPNPRGSRAEAGRRNMRSQRPEIASAPRR
jgi:hypothetical protein